MKIVYIALLPILNSSLGVINKIRGQANSLNDEDLDVEVIIFYKDGSNSIDFENFPSYFRFLKYSYFGLLRPIQLFLLWRKIGGFVKNTEYDLVYFRYPGASWMLYQLCKRFPRRIIFEHNTKELPQLLLSSKNSFYDFYTELYFARLSFRFSLGHVGKSSEFTNHQLFKVRYKYNINLKTITNGISIESFKKRITNKLDDNTINLIFVGNTNVWHGLERLFGGLKESSYEDLDFKLFLVGKEDTFLSLLSKFELLELIDKKIILTGFKSGRELDDLFDFCHFAIGSLGLHRIEIFNGVPLKHREYLSRGIPFVYSGEDEDIDSSLSKILFKIEASEKDIDFYGLLSHIRTTYSQMDESTNKLRAYAIKNVNMEDKTKELKDYFIDRINKVKLDGS